jgi:hypothetical protein
MNKAEPVIYLDAKGQEHEALVTAVNQLNPGYVSLVYIDQSRPEADNVVKLFDVRHLDTISEFRVVKDSSGNDAEEGNKDLPTYHLNCWKEIGAESRALPADHPAFDHPHLPTSDADGKAIPVDRPEYDADVFAHQTGGPVEAPVAEVSEPDPQQPLRDTIKTQTDALAAYRELAIKQDQKIEQMTADLDAAHAELAKAHAELATTTEGRDAALQAVADAGASGKSQAAEASSGEGIEIIDSPRPE